MTNTLPISQAREKLTTIVDDAQKKFSKFTITVNGTPAAVVMSHVEYVSWEETNEILDNPSLLSDIKLGEEELEEGKYVTFEQLKKNLKVS